MSLSTSLKRQKMLLLEVLLSMSVMTVLALMMMGNLGYFFLRGQKEKVQFAKDAETQIFDMMISKLLEEIIIQAPSTQGGELPLYIEEREGKKCLVFFIVHSLDAEEKFRGPLRCDLSFVQGVLKLREANEGGVVREVEMLKAKDVKYEFFDPEMKEWTNQWIKDKDYLPPLLKITIEKESGLEKLHYLTPYLKNPIPI